MEYCSMCEKCYHEQCISTCGNCGICYCNQCVEDDFLKCMYFYRTNGPKSTCQMIEIGQCPKCIAHVKYVDEISGEEVMNFLMEKYSDNLNEIRGEIMNRKIETETEKRRIDGADKCTNTVFFSKMSFMEHGTTYGYCNCLEQMKSPECYFEESDICEACSMK